MALKVWVPLNGDAKNQGVSNCKFTINGNEIFEDGKVTNNALLFRDNVSVTTDYMPKYKNNFTVAVWIYKSSSNTINTEYALSESRVDATMTGWGFHACPSSYWYFSNITIQSGDIKTDEWHHIAMTVDEGMNVTSYLDGNVISKKTCVKIPSYNEDVGIGIGCFNYNAGKIYHFTGKMNDFRIYDTCLSPKEIRDIVNGLSLHFKLSHTRKNLLKNTQSFSNFELFNNNGATFYVDKSLTFNGNPTLRVNASPSSPTENCGCWDNTSLPHLKKGHVYCYSCKVWSNESFDFINSCIGHFQVHNSKANHNWSSIEKYNVKEVKANTWSSVNITFIVTDDAVFIPFFIYFKNASHSVNIAELKLEEGYTPTPWCPHDNDYFSSKSSNIEFDCSGYNHNGSLQNILNISSDTPRYIGSYNFNGNGNITFPRPLPENPKEATFCFWIKPSNDDGEYPFILGNSSDPSEWNWISINCEGSSVWRYYHSNYVLSEPDIPLLDKNKWYFIAIVYNDSDYIYYINDNYISTIKNTVPDRTQDFHLHLSSTLCLGNGFTGNTWNTKFYGNISDFRIYGTALKEEDVKDIYKSSIMVDNHNNLYCSELIEGN